MSKHTLPDLPYSYDALEPYIDKETMKVHHDKHHQAYLDKLKDALSDYPDLQDKNIEDLLANLDDLPEDIRGKVRNHGGGYYHHSLFWLMMSPNGGGEPNGDLAGESNKKFGGFESLKDEFITKGQTLFGSGWVWLVLNQDNELEIIQTPNQSSPVSQGLTPLLGNDVWEHAYYLKYQNRRADYLKNWWNVVNWDYVVERFNQVKK